MENKLRFNRYNLLEEMEELSQVVSYFSEKMAEAKREWVKAEKEYNEFLFRNKEEQKICYSICYKRLLDEEVKITDVKAKQLAYIDDEYVKFIEDSKKINLEMVENLSQKDKAFEIAKSNYYSASGKRQQISDAIKLLIGGFFELSTEKISKEVEEIKGKKKLINIKKNK